MAMAVVDAYDIGSLSSILKLEEYEIGGQHHGKPVYRRRRRPLSDDIDNNDLANEFLYLYFFDDGNHIDTGWWLGPEVGGEVAMAFNECYAAEPPEHGWRFYLVTSPPRSSPQRSAPRRSPSPVRSPPQQRSTPTTPRPRCSRQSARSSQRCDRSSPQRSAPRRSPSPVRTRPQQRSPPTTPRPRCSRQSSRSSQRCDRSRSRSAQEEHNEEARILVSIQGEWLNARRPNESYSVHGCSVTRRNVRGSTTFRKWLKWNSSRRRLLWGSKGRYFLQAEVDRDSGLLRLPGSDCIGKLHWQKDVPNGMGFLWRRVRFVV